MSRFQLLHFTSNLRVELIGVSLGWAWKVSAARNRTGRMERPSYRPGAKEPLLKFSTRIQIGYS
jgi:hypothetical protein